MMAVTAALTAILNSLRGASFHLCYYSLQIIACHSSTCQEVQCSVGILQALSAVLQELLFWSAHPLSIAIHQHTIVELAQM